ncbi:LysR family transcriptional regulator, partial [Streptomyces sp. NPDC001130]
MPGILGRVETASLDLNLLRTFLAVYRSGSFTGASRRLGLSQIRAGGGEF